MPSCQQYSYHNEYESHPIVLNSEIKFTDFDVLCVIS